MSSIGDLLNDKKLMAFSSRNPDFMPLAMKLDDETRNNLLETYRKNPALLENLEHIKKEDPTLVGDLAAIYKTSPQAFSSTIARISESPDTVLANLKKNKELATGPQAQTLPEKQVEAGNPAQSLAETTISPASTETPGQPTTQPAAPVTTSALTPSAPSGVPATGNGGNDKASTNLGFQALLGPEFMASLDKIGKMLEGFMNVIAEALGGLFEKFLPGLKDVSDVAGNGITAKNLLEAAGVSPQNVSQQIGNAEPKVGMVGFNPAQPGVYRDQQPRMPTDPLLDRTLNPSPNLRPGEAMS